MAWLTWTFDLLVAGGILLLGWRALATSDLFQGVVAFMAMGLLLALAWARLGALDVALAEAAIGAGITGVLLLSGLSRLGTRTNPPDNRQP